MPDSKKTILIGRCNHSDLEYLYYWLEKVKNKALQLGFEVIDLDGKNFQSEDLIKNLERKNPFMVILCGHGNKTTIFGYDNKKVVELCNEDKYFKGKIIYAISCYTAELLGKSASEKQCENYIGWIGGLDILFNIKGRPGHDEIAGPCIEILMQIPIAILHGDDVHSAYKKCHENLDALINDWRHNRKFISMASGLELVRDGLQIDGMHFFTLPPTATHQ